MANPKQIWTGLDKSDRAWLVGTVVAPIAVWWFYHGRNKYGTRGMK